MDVTLREQGGARDLAIPRLFEEVVPLVKSLEKRGALRSFFFVRKNPGLRLRFDLQAPRMSAVGEIEARLEALSPRRGAIAKWNATVYEPETYKFGGPEAMTAVHAYFFADSTAWWRWRTLELRSATRLDARLLSASVLNHLFTEFLEGPEEVWDVWCRLAALHGESPGGAETRGERSPRLAMADLMERVTPPEKGVLRVYASSNARLARHFRAIRAKGKLLWAHRLVLPHVAIYHWNRYGFSIAQRATIFTAMMRAWSPHAAVPSRRADEG